MEHIMRRLFSVDCTVMLVLLALYIVLLAYVTVSIAPLASNAAVQGMLVAAAVLVAVMGVASAIAVLVHLRINRLQVYAEEISAGTQKQLA